MGTSNTEAAGAERVYCGLFCEQFRQVHFHIFPRTALLLAQYMRAHPDQNEISGPRLMDWAYHAFDHPIPGVDRDEMHRKIRDYLRSA